MKAWHIPGALCLLLLGSASAPPPEDCDPAAASGPDAPPMPLDLAGRPDTPAALGAGSFAAPPVAPAPEGCHGPLPSARSTTLRNESDDVLHGLLAPDTLRPIDEPERAPLFR